ncbi:cholesterol oxidase substrate-binding domain-containing protein [Streptomyces gobiensis]|uniref:cholesterol oxidase substrate-binding domain-containing protein n=1 Tax=Streptomyces gobiensis TaxID=2875706 RepID=UPI001E33BCCC|nr:cholesterol oxidase substrate-binding domain-containing protein [Streptomyces gobiensis]UGY92301.1 FAD-binding protein [Streptomyces gobiensis]
MVISRKGRSMGEKRESPEHLGRRRVLAAAAVAAGAAVGWTPAFRLEAHAAGLAAPAGFPAGIRLVRQAFRNWSGEIALDAVWTALPASAGDVVTLADWARNHRWRLRAKGMGHGWSPLIVRNGEDIGRVVLVDTTAYLTGFRLRGGDPAMLTAEAGTTMDVLHGALEAGGYGLTGVPQIGDLTLGGALAIGAHGTGVPLPGRAVPAGTGFGTMSDLVDSLTAVVWDDAAGRHTLRTFSRENPDTAALLVHLGRAFITEATLRVPVNIRLRCRSSLDVPVEELLGPPGSGGHTLEQDVARAGRIEVQWLPYTRWPWLKVWTQEPVRPAASRRIDAPYPYSFYDNLPEPVSDLAREILHGAAATTPLFTTAVEGAIRLGLTATVTWDLWGWSKNTLLYLRPNTLRYAVGGWAVLCARSDVQRVVHDFYSRFAQRLAADRARGVYPVNGPVGIRVTAADHAGAGVPLLSAARPRPGRPAWDTVVWFNAMAFPGTPGADAFLRSLEQWMIQHFSGWSAVRPEWSKGWAYGANGAWSDSRQLASVWPDDWNDWLRSAAAVLNRHDPAGVFSSPFLNTLFP